LRFRARRLARLDQAPFGTDATDAVAVDAKPKQHEPTLCDHPAFEGDGAPSQRLLLLLSLILRRGVSILIDVVTDGLT
jgi:hypothetical protein